MTLHVDQKLSHELGKLDDTQSLSECLAQVRAVLDLYQVGHGCLQSLHAPLSPNEALWRVTPPDVTLACSSLIKLKRHPALVIGKTRHFPFDLFDFRDQFSGDPDTEALYQAFENNGLAEVYGLPIQSETGTFVFVVGRPGEAISLTELLALQTICHNAINKIVQFKHRPRGSEATAILTSDQRRVLIAVAKGMDIAMSSDYLDLPQATVAMVQEQVVDQLGAANIRHAIVLALIAGEFTLDDCSPDQPQSIAV